MGISRELIVAALDNVDHEGWDGPAGRSLLELVRMTVVVPVVRRSRLSGPAADQAAATGWAVAWEVLTRPSARTAENPGGLLWVAVTRAVLLEVGSAALGGGRQAPATGCRVVPLDQLGETLEGRLLPRACELGGGLGPLMDRVARALVESGWDAERANESLILLSESLSHQEGRGPRARWRRVAVSVAMPEWRVRRLAELLLGVDAAPGLLAVLVEHGPVALEHHAIRAALRSTTRRHSLGPIHHLAEFGRAPAGLTGSRGRSGKPVPWDEAQAIMSVMPC